MMVPPCRLCSTSSFFDFGCDFVLCADCAATMLKRFEILTSDTPVSVPAGVAATVASEPPEVAAAVPFDELLMTPGYVRRSAA